MHGHAEGMAEGLRNVVGICGQQLVQHVGMLSCLRYSFSLDHFIRRET